MLKLLFYDYIANIKAAWRQDKQNQKNGMMIYWIVYLLIFIPGNMSHWSVNSEVWSVNYLYFLQFVPIIVGFFMGGIYPNRLGKSMFLCPMTEKERKTYLYTSYAFRVILYTVPYLLLEAVCAYFCQFSVVCSVIRIASYVLLMLVIQLTLDKETVASEKKSKIPRLFGYGTAQGFASIVGLIAIIVFQIISGDSSMSWAERQTVMIKGFVIQLIFSGIYLIGFFNRIIDVAQDYEKSYCK